MAVFRVLLLLLVASVSLAADDDSKTDCTFPLTIAKYRTSARNGPGYYELLEGTGISLDLRYFKNRNELPEATKFVEKLRDFFKRNPSFLTEKPFEDLKVDTFFEDSSYNGIVWIDGGARFEAVEYHLFRQQNEKLRQKAADIKEQEDAVLARFKKVLNLPEKFSLSSSGGLDKSVEGIALLTKTLENLEQVFTAFPDLYEHYIKQWRNQLWIGGSTSSIHSFSLYIKTGSTVDETKDFLTSVKHKDETNALNQQFRNDFQAITEIRLVFDENENPSRIEDNRQMVQILLAFFEKHPEFKKGIATIKVSRKAFVARRFFDFFSLFKDSGFEDVNSKGAVAVGYTNSEKDLFRFFTRQQKLLKKREAEAKKPEKVVTDNSVDTKVPNLKKSDEPNHRHTLEQIERVFREGEV